MIKIRKLAAIDIALHGSKFVLAKFGFAVAVLGYAGLSGLLRGHGRSASAWYFLCLSVNYLPLLIYSVLMIQNKSALEHAAPEIHERVSVRRYTLQQLWLLVPLFVPLAAILQELKRGE
jgi:hypothetical protein